MKSGSQKLKKFLAFVMTVVMVLTAVPLGGVTFSASAEDGEFTEGYYTYTVKNGEAKITDCDESISGDIVIPDTLGGYPVTYIGDYAFYGCTGLTSISIGNSVTSIGYNAFYDCTGLTSITIPDSVTSIGEDAFYGCSGLTSVTMGNSVTSIGDSAFYGCESLTSITIPNSVTSIGSCAFAYCSGLTSITVYSGNTVYHSTDNCLIETESKTLVLGCKNSIIPSDGSVTSIGDSAFYGCESLTSITIPDSVTSISDCAFCGCTSLTSVTLGNGTTSIGINAFYYCNSLTSITIPDSVTSIGEAAFVYCSGLTSITVSSGNKVYHSTDNCLIETESKTLILGCKNSIIPSDGSVTSIGVGAFGGCTVTSVTIPNSVTSIGAGAFDNCTSLTSVTIPDSVTSIGNYAFEYCTSLTSITIPDSVTSIVDYAFCDCTSLTSITIPDSVTSIGEDAFCRCTGLTSITIPDSVTSIGDWAFEECTGLTSITISDSVTSIGEWAFYGCTGLTSVTLGNGVTSIGGSVFRGCTRLTNITIPDSVTSIGSSAFYNCTGLTSITIPSSVTDIGHEAFGYYYDESTHRDEKVDKFTIYGYTGAAAETYANKNGFVFIDLDEVCSHSFAEQISRQPTCTKDGEKLFTCTQCGYSYSEVMPATGHTDADNDGICDVCSKIIVYTITVGETKTIDIEENEITLIRFVPEESGTYIFESLSDDDTYGYLYDKNYEELCSDNDSGDDFNFSIEYYLEAGEVYYFGAKFLDDADSGSFDVRLKVSDSPERYYTYTVRYGEATITRCDRSISGDVVIPDTLGGYPVTSIESVAFYECPGLTSITIPDSVTSIGVYAFSGCTDLTSVTIGKSVTSIGEAAFEYCTGLTSITIPDSVTSIGSRAFSSCESLTSITIPDSVTEIGDDAFCATAYYNNNSNWENDVLYIGNHLIEAKTSISGVYSIKDGTKTIAEDAFGSCTGLTNITIPDSVTSIGDEAFRGCTGLTSITIPDSVTEIGDGAFWATAYYNNNSNWENDVLYIGNHLIEAKTSISGVYSIKDGTRTIAVKAFYGCTGLTSITIPDSVTSIGDFAFHRCTELTSVTMGNSVTSIGNYAFEYCTGLTSITIPDSVTSIGKSAFYGCSGLTSITIPNSVTSIGKWAFGHCTGLTSVTIGNSVTSIGDEAFIGCTGLTSITIPDSVTSIGGGAFALCESLTSITVSSGNTAYHSADNCLIETASKTLISGCKNSIIPSDGSVTSIGMGAFGGCTVTSVTIPNSVTSINIAAFAFCTGLTSITIPDSVTSIGEAAFFGCTGLTSITIPSSVTDIGDEAFGYYYDKSTPEYEKVDNFTIYGYTGTAAETYANKNGFAFIALDEEHTHTYSDWVVTTEPTCTAEGEETRTCSVCSATETRPVEKKAHTFGEWVTTKEATVFESGERKRNCTACGFEETEEIEKLEAKETKDENTGISVVYPDSSYEGEVEISVTQTFDGASYHVLNAEKGNYQKALFDITTLVDGNKVQPNGSVFVKIPLPDGYNAEKTVVYYITNDGRLEKMDSRVEDGYIVFETTHFSFYAIVDETEKQPENPSANCSCACHKKGIAKLFFKIKLFFQKIFKKNRVCKCGVNHY